VSDWAIRVEGLGKRYRIGRNQPARNFRQRVGNAIAAPWRLLGIGGAAAAAEPETIWALRDTRFEVRRGEVLGVIGSNGAGKSTLLKILSRITEPTEGRAEIRGRVGSLLEVGTGFHPELTGRENTYLNGAILGMRKADVDRNFDRIVEFAGIGRFIDTPVKRYSSGMYTRLAFAVAAHLEPEILIVDEVLAVGDMAFQRKCLGKMDEVAQGGRTVLFVSHNMAAISNLCSRAILLDEGVVVYEGSPDDAVAFYARRGRDVAATPLGERDDRIGSGDIRFTRLDVTGAAAVPGAPVVSGEPVEFRLEYTVKGELELDQVEVGLIVRDARENVLFTLSNQLLNSRFAGASGSGAWVCRVPALPLARGDYVVRLWSAVDGVKADVVDFALQFQVLDGDYFGSGQTVSAAKQGPIVVAQEWRSIS
jgi:lipopolysaccharide transport system ATP-binding protein